MSDLATLDTDPFAGWREICTTLHLEPGAQEVGIPGWHKARGLSGYRIMGPIMSRRRERVGAGRALQLDRQQRR